MSVTDRVFIAKTIEFSGRKSPDYYELIAVKKFHRLREKRNWFPAKWLLRYTVRCDQNYCTAFIPS